MKTNQDLPEKQALEIAEVSGCANISKMASDFFIEYFDLPVTIEDSNTFGAGKHQFIDLMVKFHEKLMRTYGNVEQAIDILEIELEHNKSGYKEDERFKDEYSSRVLQVSNGLRVLRHCR